MMMMVVEVEVEVVVVVVVVDLQTSVITFWDICTYCETLFMHRNPHCF